MIIHQKILLKVIYQYKPRISSENKTYKPKKQYSQNNYVLDKIEDKIIEEKLNTNNSNKSKKLVKKPKIIIKTMTNNYDSKQNNLQKKSIH